MSQPSKTDQTFREPSHFDDIAKALPNVIHIVSNPDRLIDWDKSDLKPELLEWFSKYIHSPWTWDAAITRESTLYLKFFFYAEVDAVFFRLAHSY